VIIHQQDELNVKVETAARLGLQVAVHAIGDRAIGMALTAIEKSNLTVPQSQRLRHRIEHASVLNRSLVDRIRDARAIVSVQPHFIVSDVWVPDRVGRERAKLVYPLRLLMRSGATVVGGSDCPVEPIDPLEGIYSAVACAPEGYGERIDAQTAVRMFTKNAAYATHEEKLKGMIEEGKMADLVVLDRNPMKVAPEELRRTNVLATIVGGKLVYTSKRFRAMRTSSVRGQLVRRCS
ncbi:amidohydrolase, partial [[Eubacterium] cellulosolvens]